MARSRFLQVISSDGSLRETAGDASSLEIKRDYIVRGGAFDKVRDAVGAVLKWATRMIYISPLLVVGRLILSFANGKRAEGMVVVFVAIVVLFFVVLNLYLLASFIAWYSHSRAVFERRQNPGDFATAIDVTENTEPGRVVKIVGRAVALDPNHPSLVADFWSANMRATELSAFAVIPKSGPPAIIVTSTAPSLLADSIRSNGLATLSRDAGWKLAPEVLGEGGTSVGIFPGDTVEVKGRLRERIANVAEFSVDGETYQLNADEHDEQSPYRAATQHLGFVIADNRDEPLVIRVLSRANARTA